MTKKVNYPTQAIPPMTPYRWRKAIKEAEDAAHNAPLLDVQLKNYYFDKRDELKAQYADWRKEQQIAVLIRDQWKPKNWAKLDALTREAQS